MTAQYIILCYIKLLLPAPGGVAAGEVHIIMVMIILMVVIYIYICNGTMLYLYGTIMHNNDNNTGNKNNTTTTNKNNNKKQDRARKIRSLSACRVYYSGPRNIPWIHHLVPMVNAP